MRGSFKLSTGGGTVLPPGAVMPQVTLAPRLRHHVGEKLQLFFGWTVMHDVCKCEASTALCQNTFTVRVHMHEAPRPYSVTNGTLALL